jgi:hypothetical protein
MTVSRASLRLVRVLGCAGLMCISGCCHLPTEPKPESKIGATVPQFLAAPAPVTNAVAAVPSASALPADIPVYPDGSITASEVQGNQTTVLMTTKNSWKDLRSFYSTALVPAGWTVTVPGASGQMLARFEKNGRTLVIQMQPGRQEQNLIRIVFEPR